VPAQRAHRARAAKPVEDFVLREREPLHDFTLTRRIERQPAFAPILAREINQDGDRAPVRLAVVDEHRQLAQRIELLEIRRHDVAFLAHAVDREFLVFEAQQRQHQPRLVAIARPLAVV